MTLLSKGQLTFYLVTSIILGVFVAGYIFASQALANSTRQVSLPDILPINSSHPIHSSNMISGELFGTSPSSDQALAVTNLNLTLKGTLPVTQMSQSKGIAIIMIGSNKDKVVYQGESIQRGVTLDNVYEHYVVLSRGTKKEILKFPKSDDKYLVENMADHGMKKRSPPVVQK
ncbi:hypothetical protein MSP8887_02339 [Marinomonas spartinae]|uniref:type II secretion system protein N n=1 Tax=Marinomonas spartinae TaxID=1792290 RepID=UPI000808B58B|nr:type II secretion system protein N [Marinomonas spartinae]SBS35239.1 hypothetical protein MSP8887_02339 [Marinomonas spartinae]